MNSVITEQRLDVMQKKFVAYMSAKRELDQKILENEKWYKGQYKDMMGDDRKNDALFPVTSFLFNAIANKHAEVMDSFPFPNILAREKNDEKEADMLSKIVPFELEAAAFRQTYSKAWWYKLKNGTVAYGVFFNPDMHCGTGDIDIQRLNIQNLFWEPGIENIQKSDYFFIINMLPNDYILAKYPHAQGHLGTNRFMVVQSSDANVDMSEKSLVVDCYYKKYQGDKMTVHLTKFIGNAVLDSSEDHPETKERGLYDHGLYPVIFDVLYPIDGSPVGFGLVDIAKNPQSYIDRLDYIISKNALISGKVRWMVRENSGVNEEELLDLSKDIIHVATGVREENIREFQARPLDAYIMHHRNNKIAELKEIIGNRDFNQGGNYGGITAYRAIVALQEAGNKLARDMINESYESYKQIIYMCIELIRQFFDGERSFRITGKDGGYQYLSYSNKRLKTKEKDYRMPMFDIMVQPEKNNPFSRIAQNDLAMEFFKLGMFHMERSDEALATLEVMNFEGKEKMISMIKKNAEKKESMPMMQLPMQAMQMAKQGEQTPGEGMQMPIPVQAE